ncbi:MAG: helix-turn-helix domain-containing protein [Clostridia bacterium]|nr:helix-turn-helix domain-containing protein [Clostridia bacterium]
MDAESCGELIRKLRKEAGLTQRELADRLCVTDKAVSKWERGMGCPDISMLGALTREFRVDIESLLSGALPQRPKEGGNMKRVCFAICPTCGNLFTASAPAQVCCCGRKLDFPAPTPADQAHLPHMEQMEDELCFTFDHSMTKEHHLNFVALITFDRMIFVRLYPEQDPLVRMPYVRTGTLVYGCTQHGLMSADIRKL